MLNSFKMMNKNLHNFSQAETAKRIYSFQKPSNFELVIKNASLVSIVWIGIFAAIVALELAQFILAPILLAIVIGLMLIPAAKKIEHSGISSFLSSALVVVSLILIVASTLAGLSVPLTEWTEKLPTIWFRISSLLSSWQQTLLSLGNVSEIFNDMSISKDTMKLEFDNAEAVKDVAVQVPVLLSQFIIFIVSLYFFVATREQFRTATLSLCLSRSLKLRTARTFRDIEASVSSYLTQITFINIGLGATTAFAMWILDIPSPLLWGVLAALLNYIVYLGPVFMTTILVLVGLSLGGTLFEIMTPAMVFLGLNLIEANFVTPNIIGKRMTMNPFVVFLSLAFWLWIWGPVGGFVAVPTLLILYALVMNIIGINTHQKLKGS
jgi:predicted PurR-regulated permease PerM